MWDNLKKKKGAAMRFEHAPHAPQSSALATELWGSDAYITDILLIGNKALKSVSVIVDG